MKQPIITLKVPLFAARFLYNVLLWYLSGGRSDIPNTRLTPTLRKQLDGLCDELFYQLSMADERN